MPPADLRTEALLTSKGKVPNLRVGIGCPVWGVKEWVGKVYPRGAQPAEYLRHYARQFNSIELNSTHYRIPDPTTVRSWREQSPDDFRFCPKFPQEISHRSPLGANKALVNEFVHNLMGLGERLGISFLQLPPLFSPRDLPELDRFLNSSPEGFPIAVEVRHPGFFENQHLIPAYYDLLKSHDAHVVITDVAGRRDVMHTSLTSKRCLVRFIGNSDLSSDQKRVDAWVKTLTHWIQNGLEHIEFFVHQPDNQDAPELVTYLIEALNRANSLHLRTWEPQNQGEQLGFF